MCSTYCRIRNSLQYAKYPQTRFFNLSSLYLILQLLVRITMVREARVLRRVLKKKNESLQKLAQAVCSILTLITMLQFSFHHGTLFLKLIPFLESTLQSPVNSRTFPYLSPHLSSLMPRKVSQSALFPPFPLSRFRITPVLLTVG